MTAPATPQTRKNRSTGGRKAAAFVRRNNRYGPDGSARGSAPLIDGFDTILARLRATVARRQSDRPFDAAQDRGS